MNIHLPKRICRCCGAEFQPNRWQDDPNICGKCHELEQIEKCKQQIAEAGGKVICHAKN